MANRKISELVSRTPSLTDLMLVGDPSSGYSYKCTVHDIANIIESDIGDAYVTLTTTQSISGAKTFSNVLTLTSVANSSVDTDKFLVLTASNTVNYRTGAEVLSDIGGASSSSISGTTNYIPKFTSSSAIGNSIVYETGGKIGINTSNPAGVFEANAGVGTSFSVQNAGTNILNVSNYSLSDGYNTLTLRGGSVSFWTGTAGGSSTTERVSIASNGNVTLSVIANATTDTDKFLVSDSGVIKYRTGAELLSDIGGQGSLSLSAIGSTPNANGATLSSNTLTLQPASASFGGVMTTGFQEFAGQKRFVGNPIQFDKHLEIKNNNSWGVSWGYTSFASKDTPVFGFLRGHSFSPTPTSYNAWFTYGSTGDRNYTLPSSDGTLALTSDITSSISGTTNYIPKFTGTSAIGNSQIFDNGTSVGIGTATPAVTLAVYNTSTPKIHLQNSTSGVTDADGFQLAFSSSDGYIWNYENGGIRFATNNTERMRLDASGNLGLGTSSPTQKLDVTSSNTTSYASSSSSLIQPDGGVNALIANTGSAGFSSLRFASLIGSYAVGYIGFNNTTSSVGGSFVFGQRNGTSSYTEQMRLDASGNLGLGVTPSAWNAGGKAIEIGMIGSAHWGLDQTSTYRTTNAYWNTGWKYGGTGQAANYAQEAGSHYWSTAPSGTAGNAISFTQAMTLDASGNLGIGTTTPQRKIDVIASSNDVPAASFGRGLPIGNWSGVHFGYSEAGNSNYRKSAIVFERTGSAAEGKIHILNNGTADISNATLADARLTILPAGNVGIGTTSPSTTLTVKSTNDNGYALTRPSDATTLHWRLSTTETGTDAYTVTYNTFNNEMIFSTYANGGTGGNIIWRTSNSGTGGLTERMRITSGGNVGIGNTPSDAYTGYKLQIGSTSDSQTFLSIGNSTTGVGPLNGLVIGNDGTGADIYQRANAPLRIYTNNTERMRITSGGNVGIGTTNPTEKLEVNGAIKTAAPSGYTAKPWKLGDVTVTSITVDTDKYISVDINGTVYNIPTCHPN